MKLAELDLNKVYTYADYLTWDFKERVELIMGKIFKMSPAPASRHQKLSMDISGQLWNHLRKSKCRVYTAPFDVRLPKKSTDEKDIVSVVQPDISVICDESKVDAKGCLGPPDIVVEILSPGNNALELNNKFDLYQEAGVKEYWIVSPQDNTFQVNTLKDGRYVSSPLLTVGKIVTSTSLPGFSMDLGELFSS